MAVPLSLSGETGHQLRGNLRTIRTLVISMFEWLGELERRIIVATAKNPPVETNTHDLLIQAIREKRLIRFLYNGKGRIAEPHDYGIQKGSSKLLSYQVGGESTTGGLPDWRSVDVPKISKLELLEEHFAGNREVPSGQHHSWDKLYARVATPGA